MSPGRRTLGRRALLRGIALASAAGVADARMTAAALDPNRGPARGPAAELDVSSQFKAYRRILASDREEDVCCWYLGTLFLRPDDLPEIPVIQAETIMVYRARTVGPAAFRVAWKEIGYFRDPARGGAATSWLNPITGKTLPTPESFRDGPGEYAIETQTTGLGVTLQQTGAVIQGVGVTLTAQGSTVMLQQTEHKVRGGGASASAAELAARPRSTTVLTLWADRAQLEDPGRAHADASGAYSFETAALPPWTGLAGYTGSTIVRGIMRKGRPDEILNADAWHRLRGLYPDFFAGDRISPGWAPPPDAADSGIPATTQLQRVSMRSAPTKKSG